MLYTMLKIGLILIFFTIYSIVQFVIYASFFEKAQFTLQALINTRSREPYLSATFNSARAEVAEGAITGNQNYGSFENNLSIHIYDAL